MDIAAVAAEAALEKDHWWFVGRRLLFADVIRRLQLPANARILDVGTGTGSNLRMLKDLGFENVTGVDRSQVAADFCAQKGFAHVEIGDICALPLPSHQFDLVLATDVIEHVDEDALALTELRRMLKPGGRLLVTVPTFQALWGLQDEVSHHRRRYRLGELTAKMRSGHLDVRDAFYFNYLLFVPILVARVGMRWLGWKADSENELNPAWLNAILSRVFNFDVSTASRLRPPFGVSALVVATSAD
jgi:SAM-dependent methyltransferase